MHRSPEHVHSEMLGGNYRKLHWLPGGSVTTASVLSPNVSEGSLGAPNCASK